MTSLPASYEIPELGRVEVKEEYPEIQCVRIKQESPELELVQVKQELYEVECVRIKEESYEDDSDPPEDPFTESIHADIKEESVNWEVHERELTSTRSGFQSLCSQGQASSIPCFAQDCGAVCSRPMLHSVGAAPLPSVVSRLSPSIPHLHEEPLGPLRFLDQDPKVSDETAARKRPQHFTIRADGFTPRMSFARYQQLDPAHKPYLCTDCGKAYKRMDHLKRHQQMHSGEKPYHCGTCEKRFSLRRSLEYHQRQCTGESYCKCAVCGDVFQSFSNLHRHQLIHAGEKTYQCGRCGQKCKQSNYFKKHQKVHTEDEPYFCLECEQKFILD
ncbi:zinc finger protein 610 [Amia ocellicauda]|uniref:zinc finger protein 610 n=1 Tax=Amia ocellicauda TaxID=2972642 RepID=UPI0034642127